MIDARGMEVECLYGLYCCAKRIMFDEIRLHHQEPWMLTAYIGIFAKKMEEVTTEKPEKDSDAPLGSC